MAPLFHEEAGIYHTHGAPVQGQREFLRGATPDGIGDTGLSDELQVPNYLETPSPAIRKYDPCLQGASIASALDY